MSAARYKVEHCDTRGVWVPAHRGTFKRYSDALAKKQAFCRVMADYAGNGVWEEVETLPNGYAAAAKWEREKRVAEVNARMNAAMTPKERRASDSIKARLAEQAAIAKAEVQS